MRNYHPNFDRGTTRTCCDDFLEEEPNAEAKKFYNLKDFESPLFQNSKASKHYTFLKLLHIKSMGCWSNASFTNAIENIEI